MVYDQGYRLPNMLLHMTTASQIHINNSNSELIDGLVILIQSYSVLYDKK